MSSVVWVGNILYILGLLLISGILRDVDGIYGGLMSLVGYWLISVSLLIVGLPLVTQVDVDRPLNSTMGTFFSALTILFLSCTLVPRLYVTYGVMMMVETALTLALLVAMWWARVAPKPRYNLISKLLDFVRWYWLVFMTYSCLQHSLLLLIYLLEFF